MALESALMESVAGEPVHTTCCELLDSVSDIIFSIDWDGHFLWANRAVEAVLGYSSQEIVGRNVLDMVAPHHAARILARLDARKTGHDLRDFFEFEAISRSGERRWLETNARVLVKNGFPIGLQGVARDVTDRKRLELELRKAQALEAMGLLAGGIAHDFNNAMTIILGHSRGLQALLDPADAAREDVIAIEAAAGHAVGLTRQLTVISRGRGNPAEPMILNAAIEHVRPMMRDIAGPGVALEIDLAPDLPLVLADATQIEQVVLNLVSNARDAMPEGGRIFIRTQAVRRGTVSGVSLTLRDTGAGIPEPLLARIFEPFVTTRKGQLGGIGLFVVREVVRQSRAEIEVSSTPGVGTEFRLFFPASGAAAETCAPEARTPPAGSFDAGVKAASVPDRPGRLLVADDDESVLAAVKQMLESAGHIVRTVSNGWEAERVLNAEPFDLFLTDLVMPDREGIETIVAVRRRFPRLGIIAMSGAYHGLLLRSAVMLGADVALDKPFERDTVLEKVGKVLKSRRGN